jgi:alpha-L-fucosidase
VIPQASVEILTRVGEWVGRNGESIYGTTAGPFADLAWGYCTVKDETLYLHVFDWPEDGKLEVRGLRNRVREARLLVDAEHKLPITRQGNAVSLELPAAPLDEVDTVIAMQIEGPPDVEPPVVRQEEDGTVLLDYVHAITAGKTVKRFNRRGRFHISKWTGPSDTITWHLDVVEPGTFVVRITFAAQQEWAGREYVVSIGPAQLVGRVEHTGDWYAYQTFDIGTITLADAARYTLRIAPRSGSTEDLMYFQSLQLVRPDGA